MKAEQLLNALAELEARGWPLVEGDIGFWTLKFPDGLSDYFQYENVGSRHAAVIIGWAVAQLEARGLHEFCDYGPNYDLDDLEVPLYFVAFYDDAQIKHCEGIGDTKLSATLKAALSLPASSSAAGGEG